MLGSAVYRSEGSPEPCWPPSPTLLGVKGGAEIPRSSGDPQPFPLPLLEDPTVHAVHLAPSQPCSLTTSPSQGSSEPCPRGQATFLVLTYSLPPGNLGLIFLIKENKSAIHYFYNIVSVRNLSR